MPSLSIPYLHTGLHFSTLFFLIINSQQACAYTTIPFTSLQSATTHQSRTDNDNNYSVKNSCPIVLPRTREEARSSQLSSSIRIIGGSTPDPSIRSHLISFSQQDGSHVCTGSLISSRWALTAGHCFIQQGMNARLGGIDSNSGTTLNIDTVITHPRYNDNTLDFDISLVRFTNTAPLNATFIKISSNSFVPVAGAYARNTGYGENEYGTGTLLQVDVPIIDTDICRLAYGLGDIADVKLISHSKHICAGHLSGGCGACFGDSGGPLAVFNSKGDIVQIGITSFGNSVQCAAQLGPTVYTKVSRFLDWMKLVGVKFTEETQIVTVLGEDSKSAKDVGFSIGNLTPIQSVLIIIGIILVLILIIAIAIVCVYDQRRKRRREQKNQKVAAVMEEGDVGGEKSKSENTTTPESNGSSSPVDISRQTMVAKPPNNEDDSLDLPSLDIENSIVQSGYHEQMMNQDDLRPLNLIQDDDDLNDLERRPTAPPVEQVHIPSFYGGDSTSTA